MRVAAIVPAAGASTRMGRPKQTLPFGNSTIIGCVLDALVASSVGRVIVVLGHYAEEVREAIGDRPVDVVVNPEPERGMLSSVQCGVRAAGDADAYLIALGDQPQLRPDTVNRLVSAASESPRSIFVPAYDGKHGHPLLLLSSLRTDILALPLDIGLNVLVAARSDEVVEVADEALEVLEDIDTPEDYQRMTRDQR